MSSVATSRIAVGPRTSFVPLLSNKSDAHCGSHDTPPAFVSDREISERKSLESFTLLFLRVAAALALLDQAIVALLTGDSVQSDIFAVLGSGAAMLLLLGLWTSFAGTVTALVETGNVLWQFDNPWTCMQLGAIGVALAMIGPGGWSLDARPLRKRIANRYSFARLRNP